METYKIAGVEIFSEGEWNGDNYSKADLNEMVKTFDETKEGVRPYVKIGHANKQKFLDEEGLPAAGWIEKLYVKGDKLLADFSDIPKKVYELIKAKAYRKVSSEIFWNIKIKDKKYSRMVGAVALLGAETPGVYNLSDILANYYKDDKNPPKTYEDQVIELHYENETETFTRKESDMPKTENEIKLELELKAKADALAEKETELKKFTAAKEASEKELADLKKFKAEADIREAKLALDAEEAKLAKFVTELEAEKLCTPAMKDMVTELLGPDKKEYSIKIKDKEEKLSKENVLKEMLKLFKASTDVNFDESSSVGERKSYKASDEDMDKEAKEYAEKNKVSYSQAAKEVLKKNKKK